MKAESTSAQPKESVAVPGVTLAAADTVNAENPWPGLYQYTEKTSGYFHGRSDEVNLLLGMVRRRLLTLFYGQSGLGKSSLIQAGLFPRLRNEHYLPVYIRLGHETVTQSSSEVSLIEQTKLSIAAAVDLAIASKAVTTVQGIDPHPQKEETLWMFLHRPDLGLRAPDDKLVAPVLVFDQFEEIFTIGRSESAKAGRESFLRDISDCVENRPPEEILRVFYAETQGEKGPRNLNTRTLEFQRQDYRIIFSLREDYLAELFDLSPLMPSLTENQMRLLPLDGWQAIEAVSIPGEKLVEPLVAREIIELVASRRRDPNITEASTASVKPVSRFDEEADAGSLKVDPSLLNMVCRELNAERQRRREAKITEKIVTDLLATDRSILRDFYEQCLSGLPSAGAVQVFVEENLLTTEGYRGMVDLTKARELLSKTGVQNPPEVIDSLVNKRLLRTFKRVDEKTTWLELTHDVLCETVRTSRTERRAREESAAREAEQKAKLAAEMEQEKRMRAEAEERELAARQRLRMLQRERALARVAIGLAIGMIFCLVVAGVLFRNTWEAGRRAKLNSELLQKRANQERQNDPLLGEVNALPYLSMALSLDRGNEKLATEAVRTVLRNDWCLPLSEPIFVMSRGQKIPLVMASFTPDGEKIAALSRSGKLCVWKAPEYDQPEVTQVIGNPQTEEVAVSGAIFSPDGRFLLFSPFPLSASVRADPALNRLQLWEWSATAGKYEHSRYPVNYSGGFRNGAWSKDHRVLVISPSQFDQPCVVLHLRETGYEPAFNLTGTAIDVSQDGKFVVAASPDGKARIYEVESMQANAVPKSEFQAVNSPTDSRIFGIGFNPNSSKVWVTTAREPMRFWDLSNGNPNEVLAGRKAIPLRVAHLSNYVDRFVLGVADGALLCEGNLDKWRVMPVDAPFVTPSINPTKAQVLTLAGSFWLSTDTLQVWDIRNLKKQFDVDRVTCRGEVPTWFIKLLEAIPGGRENPYEIEEPMRISEIATKYAKEKKSGAYQLVWDRFFGEK